MRGREGAGMVAADLLSPPRAGDGEAFREPSGPYRRELQVHRYRMLGSFQDAEDAARETMLAAWQDIGGFAEERASLRTWLYKIATSRCLNARRAASASEVAGMLEVTLESANSALKRARASLPAPAAPGGAPPAAARRWLTCRGRDRGQVRPRMGVRRPRRAGGPADDDVFIAMPPVPFGYEGKDAVTRYCASLLAAGRGSGLVPRCEPTASPRSEPACAARTASATRPPSTCSPSPAPRSAA
jgi:hypothetical protein